MDLSLSPQSLSCKVFKLQQSSFPDKSEHTALAKPSLLELLFADAQEEQFKFRNRLAGILCRNLSSPVSLNELKLMSSSSNRESVSNKNQK